MTRGGTSAVDGGPVYRLVFELPGMAEA